LDTEAHSLPLGGENMGDYAITFLLVCALVGAAFYYFIDW
jgi:hypothetical protein